MRWPRPCLRHRTVARPVRAVSCALSCALSTVVALSACGGSAAPSTDAEAPFDATSTTRVDAPRLTAQVATAPTVAGTALTSVPDTTAPARLPGLDTADAASQNLWDSWRDDDRVRALQYASERAVDALFATRWRPDARNEGCGAAADGTWRCVYVSTEQGTAVARVVIITGSDRDGYRASKVELLSDLPASTPLDGSLSDDTALDAGVAPTVPPQGTAPRPASGTGSGSGAGSGSSGSGKGTARSTTTVAAATATTSATTTPARAPEPEAPSPTPAPSGPVQAGGRTVDTVAPG